MNNQINLIISAIRKSSKFLHRDFFELESLQSSSRSTDSFAQRTCMKTLTNLQEDLGKYFHKVIFDKEEAKDIKSDAKIALVEVMDGVSNFSRSIPFFATIVTILQKKDDEMEVEHCIVNFPILGDIYYCEKGKGVFLEKTFSNFPGSVKLRVSGTQEIEDAVVSVSDNFKDKFTKHRDFGCNTFALMMQLSGKLDVVTCNNDVISSKGIKLFVEEAGGKFHVKDNEMIISNANLHDKIKQFL